MSRNLPTHNVVWPLHKDHYLTAGDFFPTTPKPPRIEPRIEYSAIVDACTEEWLTSGEIRKRAGISDVTVVCVYLTRGVHQGQLERFNVTQGKGRPRWLYRKLLAK